MMQSAGQTVAVGGQMPDDHNANSIRLLPPPLPLSSSCLYVISSTANQITRRRSASMALYAQL